MPDDGRITDVELADDNATGDAGAPSGGSSDSNTDFGSANNAVSNQDLIARLINVTASHSAAAERGSPEQPWLLAERKALSKAIREGDYALMADLAIKSPAHLAIIEADSKEVDVRSLSQERVATLVTGATSWSGTPEEVRAAFADGARFYELAKKRHADMSSSSRARYGDAEDLNAIAKVSAIRLTRNGGIIDLAMRNPTLALVALGDAGIPRAECTPAAIDARRDLAGNYIAADKEALAALDRKDWNAYAVATANRTKAMSLMAKDPTALAALGVLSAEMGIDVRSKALTDLSIVKAKESAEAAEAQKTQFKQFEASFAKDLTIEGSDPIKRWIKIQNEIERQERSASPNRNDLDHLQKLSEKAALEAAVNPRDWARLQQSRPDLMTKLVREANARRETPVSINKESTIAEKTDGSYAVNEAAVLRNAGETPVQAAHHAGALPLDRKTQEIRAKEASDTDHEARERLAKAPQLRADPSERILNPTTPAASARPPQPTQGAAPASQTPHNNQTAGQNSPGQSTSGSGTGTTASSAQSPQSQAQPGAQASATGAAASTQAAPPYVAKARNATQAKAMQHKNGKNPDWDTDLGAYSNRGQKRDLAGFVNARTPYNAESINGQLNDPRKLVFALPLSNFGTEKQWKIKKQLRKIAWEEPERFKAMYHATKQTYILWKDDMRENNKEALDRLELGRRIMAEVGYKAKIIDLAKVATHAQPMRSKSGKRLTPNARFDPHDYIEIGKVKHYAGTVKRMATQSTQQWLKDKRREGLTGIKDQIVGNKDNKQKSLPHAALSAVASFAMQELQHIQR